MQELKSASKVEVHQVAPRPDLHSYPAKMFGRLAGDVLDTYAKPGFFVLDPFCGSGTVMLKCQERGFNSLGFDINPLAVMISSAKLGASDLVPRLMLKQMDLRVR